MKRPRYKRWPSGTKSPLPRIRRAITEKTCRRRRRTASPPFWASILALSAFVAMLAGCGASRREYVVQRETCSDGRVIGLTIPAWKEGRVAGEEQQVASVSAGRIAGGFTLVTVIGYGKDTFAELRLLTPGCQLDRRYGKNGALAIAFPRNLRPARHPAEGPYELRLSYAGASRSGGAFLAGGYEGRAVVGEVSRQGTLDRAFGDDGWVLLPFVRGSEMVLQEPSGRIIADGFGSITEPYGAWVTALSQQGRLDSAFGAHGRVSFFEGPVWGIRSMELEPNGDILVDDQGGRMGTYSMKLSMLTPSGEPVAGFSERIARFWRALGFPVFEKGDAAYSFSGSVFVEGGGFALVGVGHPGTLEHVRDDRDPGVIAHFKPDGELSSPTVRFRSPLIWSVRARPEGRHLIVEGPTWGPEGHQVVLTLEPNGTPEVRVGNRRDATSHPAHSTARGR